jgi:DcuC family C4-dicarboxylate transporter
MLVHLGVSTLIFWLLSRKTLASPDEAEPVPAAEKEFRVNILKAMVPLTPIALLFASGPPLELLHVPTNWLVGPKESPDLVPARQIGAAMMVGVAVACLVGGRAIWGCAQAFCEGAGYAFSHIISLIVAAACFGQGVEMVGVAAWLGDLIKTWPGLLFPSAGALPLAFAWVSGSGMAATQSLFQFFVEPSRLLGVDPVDVGAVVSIASGAGRTMSPVAAVTLMAASMTGNDPFQVMKRVAVPLLGGMTVVVALAWWMAY